MDASPSPLALAKLIIPQIPLILTLMVMNRLGYSPCADKQDPRTEIVVAIIRKSLEPKPLGQIQAAGLKDPGIKGPLWVAKASCPAPNQDVREAVLRGIKKLGTGKETFDLPDTVDVSGEWTGHREGAGKKNPRPELGSEQAHYDAMMKEVTTPLTVLYFHGGAYFLLDPVFYRLGVAALAKKTGGRFFSVRYRLAPQSPFPSQLLDALIAYLYLLSPPEGSLHQPVQAKHIVFAGDSAGGHLSSSLLLLILTLRRTGVTSIPFHGRDVRLDLPAGIACNSPWLDISRSLPSVTNNNKYDYLEGPSATGLPVRPLPPDNIWPSNPPRAEIFCKANNMSHPLCSPITATPSHWTGAPPIHFNAGGSEGLYDEITYVAKQIYKAGGTVEYLAYDGQPHCFSFVFPTSPMGKDCFGRWAKFMRDVVEDPEGVKSRQGRGRGLFFIAKKSPLESVEVDLGNMGVDEELVRQRTGEMMGHAEAREEQLLREYHGGGGRGTSERAKL